MKYSKLMTVPILAGIAMGYGNIAKAEHISTEKELVEEFIDKFGKDIKNKDEGVAYLITSHFLNMGLTHQVYGKEFKTSKMAHSSYTPDTKMYRTIDDAKNSSEIENALKLNKELSLKYMQKGLNVKYGVSFIKIDLAKKDMVELIKMDSNGKLTPYANLEGNFNYFPLRGA